MAIAKQEILDAIGSMTVLELSQLIKDMEEKFGVSAAAAVAVAGPAAAGPAAAAVEEDPHTREQQPHGGDLTDARGNGAAPAQVAPGEPEHRSQDASAVERIRRHEVEDGQRDIHGRQPQAQRGHGRRDVPQGPADNGRDRADAQT